MPDKTEVIIIAEIGSNYNDDLEVAKKYVSSAKKAGANAIKFQTLRKDKVIAPQIFSNGKRDENPSYTNFGNLELPDDWHFILKETADENNIEFISTPFYLEAVDLLKKVGVQTYKVASGDITFVPLIESIGRTGKKVILSTGASSLHDIERVLNTLIKSGSGDIILLHCVSNYPPKWDEMNLRAMVTLKETFDLPVGISDHSPGSLIPIAAVALGATVIEKHVTFDRSLPGPDHPFATTMEEFSEMVKQVRQIEKALGTGEKVPSDSESAKQQRMRRGVYNRVTLEPVEGEDGIWLRPQHHLTRTNKS